jgi:hypothetical protein
MQLHRLEVSPRDTKRGGVLCVFEDRFAIELAWERGAPVTDTLTAAKDLAARFVDRLIQTGQGARVSSLNLPSVVAAMQRHIADWSEARRAALYAEPVASASQIAAERGQTAGSEAQIPGAGVQGGEPRLH